MNTLKDPKTCKHAATHRVSGTRDLWHCVQCGGMLRKNVELIEAEATVEDEDALGEPGRGGIVERFKKGIL